MVRAATPTLSALRDELNETCFLAVWGNKGPTVVHVEQPLRAVTLVTRVGSVLPLLGSSTGLVFASYLPEAEFAPLRDEEAHLPGVPDAKALAAQVAEIRASGLHHVHGLLMPGVNALSAPVFAVGEQIAGVITVVGAASGFHAETSGRAAALLKQAAETITARMAGVRPA